jgi:hypothetical protein
MTAEDEFRRRYHHALKCMQSGVAMAMELDKQSKETEPKHLRVGINAAMSDHGALVALLMRKGVISAIEYWQALAESAEREAASYEQRLQDITGNPKLRLGPAGLFS